MTLRSERIAGLQEDDWRKCRPNFQEPLFRVVCGSSKRYEPSARATKRHRARWPFAWTLRNPAVTDSIVGIHNAQRVSSIAGAGDIKLSPQDVRQIEQGVTRLAT
jgi:aryl-alcohol dehydrogenase-like predicted oxidoreductase